MKIQLIFGLLIYYFVFSLLFFSDISTPNPLTSYGSVSYDLNATTIQNDTTFSILDLFGTIGSFFLYVFFGIGVLPLAPTWLQFAFGGFQSILTITFVLLLINIVTDFIP